MPQQPPLQQQPPLRLRNRFDRMEWAGAFGDLGTLIPFVAGYLGVLKMDPFGVLLAFGLAMICCGAYYRTPFPVQPMKAIGAIAISQTIHTGAITPEVVVAASLVTGLFWLTLGATGIASRVTRLVSRPVVIGIILGLGMSFMLEGIRMMGSHWMIGAAGLAGTLLLLANRTVPAMFALLVYGAVCGAFLQPDTIRELSHLTIAVRTPTFALLDLSWNDLVIGTLFLALPQLPLTLGNAVIAVREENNRLFPHRPVTDRGVATSMGLMNLAGSALGGVPMCHGAGGMAGHVAFGARTGGALIILGSVLLALAVLFSGIINALFQLFPAAILGVFLFITGAQLALGVGKLSKARGELFVTFATAAFAMWNVGIAFLAGVAAAYLVKREWLKP